VGVIFDTTITWWLVPGPTGIKATADAGGVQRTRE
jgi:hypothetical protein